MYGFMDAFIGGVMLVAVQGGCPAVPPPRVSVQTSRKETHIRHDLSKEALMAMQTDTDLPYQMQDMTHVETGGMVRGDIKVAYRIDMDAVPGATAATVEARCVRYSDINVVLELTPTIFIASDYAPETCWYKEIRTHEESHIDIDAIVIDKYASRISDGLQMAFSMPQDHIAGPVAPAQVDDLKKQMGEAVMAMVDVMVRDMARERIEKQAGVDSIRGYGHIMNSCYDGDNVVHITE